MRWHQGRIRQAFKLHGCPLEEAAAFRGIITAVVASHLVPVRVMVSMLKTHHLQSKKKKEKVNSNGSSQTRDLESWWDVEGSRKSKDVEKINFFSLNKCPHGEEGIMQHIQPPLLEAFRACWAGMNTVVGIVKLWIQISSFSCRMHWLWSAPWIDEMVFIRSFIPSQGPHTIYSHIHTKTFTITTCLYLIDPSSTESQQIALRVIHRFYKLCHVCCFVVCKGEKYFCCVSMKLCVCVWVSAGIWACLRLCRGISGIHTFAYFTHSQKLTET